MFVIQPTYTDMVDVRSHQSTSMKYKKVQIASFRVQQIDQTYITQVHTAFNHSKCVTFQAHNTLQFLNGPNH